ncbi:hypothetical protein NMG60_11022326 [Bertholletia excelsa]
MALILSMDEVRSILDSLFRKKLTPSCFSVIAVKIGGTSFNVTQAFNLTTEFFNSINHKLNCDSHFVGQWLCVDGTAN